MDQNDKEYQAENTYLNGVLSFMKRKIQDMHSAVEIKRRLLYNARRELGVLTTDITSAGRSADLNQHLLEDARQLSSINLIMRELANYERMLSSPYFGRFDLKEDDYSSADKIYIGLHNIYDEEGDGDILVYDWRAPICSIFYRYEPGRASYKAPSGEISGEVTLKRQYAIEHEKLKYYFDCSLVITDDILGEVLAHNASPQMHSIVNTIQREQDLIIRDDKSDLLIAQGAAGSGKTTIALHRIAYLLYQSAARGLTSKNIVIISLNETFSRYIGSVLPELGEENVKEITFDEIFSKIAETPIPQGRVNFAETLLTDESDGGIIKDAYVFKGSRVFAEIIKRFLSYYERRLIPFNDVYYAGEFVAQKHELKALFLNNKIGTPALSRLRRMENTLLSKIHPLQQKRHKMLQEEIKKIPGHKTDYKTIARYESIKESKRLLAGIHKFTKFDAAMVYNALFSDKKRFERMCKGLNLPTNIDAIFEHTQSQLKKGFGYEDAAPLLYLSLIIDNPKLIDSIKHVVVDEAQDYLPMHYAIFGKLFHGASFTVLGDVGQSVETGAEMSVYDDAAYLLQKKKPLLLNLSKSYRASFEIMNFALKIPEKRPEVIPFERHEKEPELIKCSDSELDSRLVSDVEKALSEGFGTAAIICKTAKQAEELFERLKGKMRISLLKENDNVGPGATILPAYLSKGLEFDCVFVPYLSDENYVEGLGRKLLYIECTRALHRLSLYYSKESEILKRLKEN